MVSRAGALLLGARAAQPRESATDLRGVSLRTEVLLSLGLLMIFALALNAALLTKLWERDLIQQRLEGLSALAGAVEAASAQADAPDLDHLLPALAPPWASLAVFDASGGLVARSGPAAANEATPELNECLASGEPQTSFRGERRFFLFRWGQRLELCAPLRASGRPVGAVLAASPLEGVGLSLWGSWHLVVLFALLDGLVIALFGGYLLRRRVVGPVERLAEAAAGYSLGQPVPVLSDLQGSAEIAGLARGLEAMLAGLSAAAREREDYVERLEQAMRQLRAAQEEVVRSEKLAVVGRLAAGVAHEIGNPISSVLGYTELLRSGGLSEAEVQDSLRRINDEVERIDRIVRGLLDFARPQPSRVEPLEVNAVLAEAADLILHRQGVRRSVRLEADLAEGLPQVAADRGQLVQVLLNLMLNAVDAMPGGGTLRLASRLVEPTPEETEGLSVRARRQDDPLGSDFSTLRQGTGDGPAQVSGRLVELAVTDTGRGMAPQELARIFDPFYTTKPPGSGTGLGLAISLRLVNSIGGSLRVESRPGEGSTFRVLLPALQEGAVEEGSADE
jgi:two-component system NtrC family sensor kinase